MKKIFENILIVSMSLLWILNFSSGIIATIWLLFSGGWQFVLFGIVLGIFMPWAYSIASLPTMLVAIPLMKLAEKGKKTAVTILGFFLSLYNNFIMALWVSFVFGLMIQTNYPSLAVWLWGYATIMGPIGYMASKEGKDATGTTLGVLFCQTSYLILSFGYYILGSETTGYNLVWILLLAFSGFTSFILHKSANTTNDSYIEDDNLNYSLENEVEDATIISKTNNDLNYCTGCGKKITKNINFCTNCGKSLKG